MQWGFRKYVLSKKIKTDIFKSAFANRKLIVILFFPEMCDVHFKLEA